VSARKSLVEKAGGGGLTSKVLTESDKSFHNPFFTDYISPIRPSSAFLKRVFASNLEEEGFFKQFKEYSTLLKESQRKFSSAVFSKAILLCAIFNVQILVMQPSVSF